MNALELFSRFEGLLHYALHIRDTQEGQSLPWSAICTHMHLLAEAERTRPLPNETYIGDKHLPDNYLQDCLHDCRFAIYALVDEILMESPHHDKNSATAWYQNRLQVRYMHTDRAGELFFTKLHELSEGILADNNAGAYAPEPLVLSQGTHRQRKTQEMPPSAYGVEHAPFSALLFPEQFKNAVHHCLAAASQQDVEHQKNTTQVHTLTLSIYALCILHGFKGLYYDAHTAQALESIRRTAATLCQYVIPETRQRSETATVMTPAFYGGIYGGLDFWFILFLLAPLLLSVLWYFICADMMGQSLF